MAIYWNLGLTTRTRADADACVSFFEEKQLSLEGMNVPLEVHCVERASDWLIGVWPKGMNYASPHGSNPLLTADAARAAIEHTFDEWLEDAPPFAAAFFGAEAYDYFLDENEVLGAEGFAGLFIDEATWRSLGSPPAAVPVAPGRHAWPRARPQ